VRRGLLLSAIFGLAAAAASAQALKPGFAPLLIDETPTNEVAPVASQVVAADLGAGGATAGYKSIVYGLLNGDLYVVERTGVNTWGVRAGWPVTLPAHIYSSPAIGDLDANGTPDIVVGYGSVIDNVDGTPELGGVRAYNRNGTLLWEVQTTDVTLPAGFRDPVQSTPAIGDVDGDGTVEVVFGGLDHRLYVVNGNNGLPNSGSWPKDMDDTVFSSPALHDLDGDGDLEIITGSDRYLVDGGRLWVLRGDGTNYPGFPKDFDQVISSSPAVGDIDGDGKPEIVHGTGTFYPEDGVGTPRLPRVYAWKCDGTAPTGWPVTVPAQVFTSPALANLDGDAGLEVVVTTDLDGANGFRVLRFEGTGGAATFNSRVQDQGAASTNAGEPVIGDVLSDTGLDILVPVNGEIAVFNATGTLLTSSNPRFGTQQEGLSGVAVTDLETTPATADNKIEVIAIGGQPFDQQTKTEVWVWNPVDRTSTPPWGFFRQDPLRRGVAPGTNSCNPLAACVPDAVERELYTVTPCRVLDTRNASGDYGGPALTHNGFRTFDMTGVCGIPSTARALSVNVTVVAPTAGGFVRFSPGCQFGNVSTINFSAGQTRANNAILPISATGELTAGAVVPPTGSVHLIVDVNGYFQ
jgi:hypothetical protein